MKTKLIFLLVLVIVFIQNLCFAQIDYSYAKTAKGKLKITATQTQSGIAEYKISEIKSAKEADQKRIDELQKEITALQNHIALLDKWLTEADKLNIKEEPIPISP